MSDTSDIVKPEAAELSENIGDKSPLRRAARPAEALLGAVFLVSALLKAIDVNSFIVAIGLYGVVADDALKVAAALGTLALETALGIALLLGSKARKVLLGFAVLLLLGFSGLIVYGWAVHGISDCGCTGPIKMGPGASLLKNAFLLLLCAVALIGFRKGAPATRGMVWKSSVALLAAASVTGFAFTQIEAAPAPVAPQAGPFAEFVFTEDGRSFDLGKGEYLVAMLNMQCEHCMASVEKLNILSIPEMPTVVGLCDGDEASLQEFKLITSPQFPMHLIGLRSFYSLIGKQPPRFIYVRDGQSVQVWDDEVPLPGEIVKARQGTAPKS